MLEIVKNYWLEFGLTVVASGLTLAYKKLAIKIKEQENVKDGLLAILHDRLFQAGRYFMEQGHISLTELKNIEYLYTSYHALGGNGTGTEIYNRIKALPIKED